MHQLSAIRMWFLPFHNLHIHYCPGTIRGMLIIFLAVPWVVQFLALPQLQDLRAWKFSGYPLHFQQRHLDQIRRLEFQSPTIFID